MSYMLLIVEPAGQRNTRSEADGRALYARMLEFADRLNARGLLLAAQSLKSDSEGVRVRMRDGRQTLVDGPFAEAREMIGGYFLLNCDSREQVVALAAECPAAQWATVEVREFGPCFM